MGEGCSGCFAERAAVVVCLALTCLDYIAVFLWVDYHVEADFYYLLDAMALEHGVAALAALDGQLVWAVQHEVGEAVGFAAASGFAPQADFAMQSDSLALIYQVGQFVQFPTPQFCGSSAVWKSPKLSHGFGFLMQAEEGWLPKMAGKSGHRSLTLQQLESLPS